MKNLRNVIAFAVVAGLAVLWPVSGFSAPIYDIDKAHSSFGFSVTHMMISHVTGGFGDYDGQIVFSADDLASSKFDFTVKAASIDTRNEMRDKHLRTGDFFDVEKYPLITFKSKKVAASGDKKYVVTGDLTMKDVTKEVEIPVTVLGPVPSPFGPGTAIGIAAQFSLNRQDYHVNWNKALDNGGVMVGDVVDVTVNIEAHAK
ncbi:MAG: YceI family protein [Candidatus Omnitrophica bacterium]|nr:YceI family protein [Candidatus Omnitrophota bacterium]